MAMFHFFIGQALLCITSIIQSCLILPTLEVVFGFHHLSDFVSSLTILVRWTLEKMLAQDGSGKGRRILICVH